MNAIGEWVLGLLARTTLHYKDKNMTDKKVTVTITPEEWKQCKKALGLTEGCKRPVWCEQCGTPRDEDKTECAECQCTVIVIDRR
jgi:hypothetical protein